MKKAYHIFLLVFFQVLPGLQAQDLKKDLAIQAAYMASTPVLKITVKMAVYKKEGKEGPVLEQNFVWMKNKDAYYRNAQENEYLLLPSRLILVRSDAAVILYQTIPDKDYEAMKLQLYHSPADSVSHQMDSVRFERTTHNEKKYTVFTSGKAIVRTELYLHPEKGTVQKMTYYYDPKRYEDIRKIDIRFHNEIPAEAEVNRVFDPSTYMIKNSRNMFVPGTAYKGFRVQEVKKEE